MGVFEVINTINKYVEIAVYWGRLNFSISENDRKMKELLKEINYMKLTKQLKRSKELNKSYNVYEQVQVTNRKELLGYEEQLNQLHKKYELDIGSLSKEQLSEVCNSLDGIIKRVYDGIISGGAKRDKLKNEAISLRNSNKVDQANEVSEMANDLNTRINFDSDSLDYYKSIIVNLRVRLSEDSKNSFVR